MKRFFFILTDLWFCLIIGYSQNVTVSGSPNHYLKVDEVLTGGVRITETVGGELSHFITSGSKVLVIQMSGVENVDTVGNPDFKTKLFRSVVSIESTGTGKFEILQVDEVNTNVGGDTVVYFTDNLVNLYDNGEKIQLVKLVEGETVSVSGTVTPKAWDGEVGGVLAIIASDSVKLLNNSIIDASRRGFRGGDVPAETYPGGNSCRYGLSSSVKDTMYFKPTQLYRSGNKGEGIISSNWTYTKGTAFNVNGGGAGNGRFSGGGGGSNYSQGGDGGQQSAYCASPFSAMGGLGGFACYLIYNAAENNLLYRPRVIMGGGGGSGTKMDDLTPSKGGNGGGIVMIITGVLSGTSSASIRANGGNALPELPLKTTGSGGGGGAGGSVLIDADSIAGPLFSIQITGGNGSSTSTPAPNVSGAGGSGNGGVLWHVGNSFPAVTINLTNGAAGTQPGGATYANQNGLAGLSGTTLQNLIIPLNGFLFNTIRGTDTICANQFPNTLTASQPKGGNGSYTYEWQDSTISGTWTTLAGGTIRTFFPPALAQTTWYRRVVTSDTITDVSKEIKIFVYPAIANNTILGKDTICFNSDAQSLRGIAAPVTGGDNDKYYYTWQESTDQAEWNDNGSDATFDPGRLTDTTYYRRIVTSTAYCADTSNILVINVLPAITGNAFFPASDTAICDNSSPGQLTALTPENGDGSYSYRWQQKTETGDWSDIASGNMLQYTPGILTETTSYRRIVSSGNDDACIDTCEPGKVTIMPLISNNSILGSQVKYTCYNSAVDLTGSDPQNGFGAGSYIYLWEQRDDDSDWAAITETTRDVQSDNLIAPRYFRRTVYSTREYHECADVSDSVEVRINLLPSGNVLSRIDTLCAGEQLYVKFNVSGSSPFKVEVRGEDLQAITKNDVVGTADSIAFTPRNAQLFKMVSLTDDSTCRADETLFTWVESGTIYAVPEADAGPDEEFCGDTYVLKAEKNVPSAHGLWTASGAAFTNDTAENSRVTVNAYGPKVFTWTETNWQCVDNDEVEITFYQQPQEPDAGPDQVLEFNYASRLQAVPAVTGSGTWIVLSGSATFNNESLPDALISELADNSMLRWTVVNGNCEPVFDDMQILVNPLSIKKGFTPDGNGKNDYFDLGAAAAEKITLKVFNSAGVLVYESDDYGKTEETCWYGENMDGVKLPEGTYYYIANVKVAGKQQEVQFRSFVEIMR